MGEQLRFKTFQELKTALYQHPAKEVILTLTMEVDKAGGHHSYYAACRAETEDGFTLCSEKEYVNGYDVRVIAERKLTAEVVRHERRQILAFYVELIQLNLWWTNCDPGLLVEDPQGLFT